MKIIIQRVKKSYVNVNNKTIGSIDKGLNVLVGFNKNDTFEIVDRIIAKILKVRIFEDKENKMNLSVVDVNGKILLVSQFTLYANTKNGNRPSFGEAADHKQAEQLFKYMLNKLNESISTESGEFGSHMEVNIINDGPVTIIIDSDEN